MDEKELKLLGEQLQLRNEFEAKCKEKGWSLDDVYYSDVEFYVNPDEHDYDWDNKRGKPRPNWLKKFAAKGGLGGIRVHPVREVSFKKPN